MPNLNVLYTTRSGHAAYPCTGSATEARQWSFVDALQRAEQADLSVVERG